MNQGSHIDQVLNGLVSEKKMDVFYSFSGEIISVVVDKLFEDFEKSLIQQEFSKTVRKRIFSIAVEGIQNIERHGLKNSDLPVVSFFLCYKTNDYVGLVFGNLVKYETKVIIENKLIEFEGLTHDEIKQKYLTQLERGELSEKGGGGMGLMTLILKSNSPIKTLFTPIEEGIMYLFSTRVTVNLV